MGNKGKQRHGVPSEIARLDFHDWHGNLIDRTKGKVTEKDKGVMMIEKISNNFGVSLDFVRREIERLNREAMTETIVPDEMKDGQVQWERDERGNIVSPFKSRKWKDSM